MTDRKTRKRTSYITSKIIWDRDFDIPEWVYDYIDEYCIIMLIKNINFNDSGADIAFRYAHEDSIRIFFDNIRGNILFSKNFVKYIFDKKLFSFALLLFTKREYKVYRTIYNNTINSGKDVNEKSLIYLLYYRALIDDVFIERSKDIVKYSGHSKDEIIRVGHVVLSQGKDKYIYQQYLNRLLKILEVDKYPQLCKTCLELDIPVFYKYGDSVDAYLYLSTVIKTKWKAGLNINFKNVIINDILKELLIRIANSIDLDALKYFEYFIENDFERIKLCMGIYKSSTTSNPIIDFNLMTEIFGEYDHGLPMDLQHIFISNGGDIKTMVNGDTSKATILNSVSDISFIIRSISVEDLKYLIYNSPDFVKTIITTNILNYNNLIKIMKALFTGPFDKELWDVLNNKVDMSPTIDFRFALVLKITNYINTSMIYQQVPEYMMYNEPSVFYITRNLDREKIKYIPIEKLLPHIKNIISREEYIQFNLHYDGEPVSITKVIDYNSLIQNITTYRKYGYVCDILEVDPHEIIRTIVKYE